MGLDQDSLGWLPQIVTGLGLSSSVMGMWIIKTSSRQARLETKIESMEVRNERDHQELKDGIHRIVQHITDTKL